MPPRTLCSAVALVGLASLTAIEAGSCGNHPESLRSSSRSGLPLIDQAFGSVSPEASYNLADYGVSPLPGLLHLCGEYELGSHGELITRDLFAASMAPAQLEQTLARASIRRDGGTNVTLRVDSYRPSRIPKSCQRPLEVNAQSVLVASRAL